MKLKVKTNLITREIFLVGNWKQSQDWRHGNGMIRVRTVNWKCLEWTKCQKLNLKLTTTTEHWNQNVIYFLFNNISSYCSIFYKLLGNLGSILKLLTTKHNMETIDTSVCWYVVVTSKLFSEILQFIEKHKIRGNEIFHVGEWDENKARQVSFITKEKVPNNTQHAQKQVLTRWREEFRRKTVKTIATGKHNRVRNRWNSNKRKMQWPQRCCW